MGVPQNLAPHSIQWFIMRSLCGCFCGICSSVGSLKVWKSIRICAVISRTEYVSEINPLSKRKSCIFNFFHQAQKLHHDLSKKNSGLKTLVG